MSAEIHYSPRAIRDLDDIYDYIANHLQNVTAAQKMVNGVLDAVENLSSFPESGAKLIFPHGLDSGYRYVQYKKYLAFYHLSDTNVYVDRVLYGKQDYENLLISFSYSICNNM